MNFYIAFFMPCILGFVIYLGLNKINNYLEIALDYLVNVFIANMMSMAIIIFRNHNVSDFSLYMQNSLSFSFKYMILTMVFSIVVAVILTIIKKYFSFSIEVTNGRSKKKK